MGRRAALFIMLTDLKRKIHKLQTIDFEVATQNAIIEGEAVLIEMLQSQLEEGLTGDDTPILLYHNAEYTPRYKDFKVKYGIGTGAITDYVTLYMFGGFYAGMVLNIKRGEFTISSNVPYFEKIINRSGASVMKLSQGNWESFYQLYIEPALLKEFHKMFEQ